MKILRKSCWLIRWNFMRINSRTDCDHLLFPEFVGTLPAKVGVGTISMILPPLLLSHAPLAAQSKIEYGKSLRTGQPKVVRRANEVECSLGRMILVAELVHDVGVIENPDGTDTIRWTQLRKVMYDKFTEEAIEVTPERSRDMTIERRAGAIG